MTAPSPATTPQIAEKRIADLTVAEFETLMRGIMQETLREVQSMIWELAQELPDPDAGLTFNPEFAEQLQEFLQSPKPVITHSAESVARELGLDLNGL